MVLCRMLLAVGGAWERYGFLRATAQGLGDRYRGTYLSQPSYIALRPFFTPAGPKGGVGGHGLTACMASLHGPRICKQRAKRHGVGSILGGVRRNLGSERYMRPGVPRGCRHVVGTSGCSSPSPCILTHPCCPSTHESSRGASSVRLPGVLSASHSSSVKPNPNPILPRCIS